MTGAAPMAQPARGRMSMTEPDDRSREDRRSEEAAGWVARLQSADATEDDRTGFAAWCGRAPANREAYEDLVSLWGELKEAPVSTDRLRELRAARRARLAGGAAVVLLAVLGTSLIQPGLLQRLQADHVTAIGEIRSVILPDGSRATLNTDTALRLSFDSGRRQVELLRGEAYFDVVPMPKRPFVVQGDRLSATALGTRYTVRVGGNDRRPEVAVEAGRVAVATAGTQVELKAGDEASLAADGRLTLSRPNVAEQTAWKDGKLVFSDRPLSEVLATLGRYRRGRIVVLDTRAASQHVSGVFDASDTDAALSTLESSLPVSVTQITALMVIVRSR